VCRPSWIGDGDGKAQAPVVLDDTVYMHGHETLYAFDTRCRIRHCAPRWSTPLLGVASPSLVAHGALLYVDGAAYPADCGERPTCRPAWVAGIDAPVPGQLDAASVTPVTVARGVVYLSSYRVYAFPERCATGHVRCAPSWVGPTQPDPVTSSTARWVRPIVVEDVVLSGTDRLSAFPAGCAAGGATCVPIWVGPPAGSNLASLASDGQHVFVVTLGGALRSYEVGPAG
jgi:hypothetical protein